MSFLQNANPVLPALIATILSLRTNDKTTYGATLRMLEIGNTPSDFATCDVEKLANAIYPVGFYKNKAEQIIELSKVYNDSILNQMKIFISDQTSKNLERGQKRKVTKLKHMSRSN